MISLFSPSQMHLRLNEIKVNLITTEKKTVQCRKNPFKQVLYIKHRTLTRFGASDENQPTQIHLVSIPGDIAVWEVVEASSGTA